MRMPQTGIGLIAVGFVGWFAVTALGSRPVDEPTQDTVSPSSSARPEPEPIDPRFDTSKLRERLSPVATPRQPARDLFHFRATAKPPAAAIPVGAAVEPPRPAVAPPAAPLKLIGIAEDRTDHGDVRTAVIAGFQQLFLVKEGEGVTGRFTVNRIASDAVELVDTRDGTALRLVLK